MDAGTPLLPDAEPTLLFAICYRANICRYRAQHTTVAIVSGIFPSLLGNRLPRGRTRREMRSSDMRFQLSSRRLTEFYMFFEIFTSTHYALCYRKSLHALTLEHEVWMNMMSKPDIDICYTLYARLYWERVLLNLTVWPRRSSAHIFIAKNLLRWTLNIRI